MKQTLEELLNQHHHNLTENDHMLAAYIRTHRSACRTISIEELSDQVHLSRAAISRFAQKLGLREIPRNNLSGWGWEKIPPPGIVRMETRNCRPCGAEDRVIPFASPVFERRLYVSHLYR